MITSQMIDNNTYAYFPTQDKYKKTYENIFKRIIVSLFCRTKKHNKALSWELNKITFYTKNFDFIQEHSATTVYYENAVEKLYDRINDIWEKCKNPNWENDDEKPISLSSLYGAKTFLNYFKNDTPVPNISPYATGEIGFTWRKQNDIYTVLFTSDDKIIWSLFLNKKKISSGTTERNFSTQLFLVNTAKAHFG